MKWKFTTTTGKNNVASLHTFFFYFFAEDEMVCSSFFMHPPTLKNLKNKGKKSSPLCVFHGHHHVSIEHCDGFAEVGAKIPFWHLRFFRSIAKFRYIE